LGYEVENPAEHPLPADAPWNDYLRVAVHQMLTFAVVATLPGWDKSQGATL